MKDLGGQSVQRAFESIEMQLNLHNDKLASAHKSVHVLAQNTMEQASIVSRVTESIPNSSISFSLGVRWILESATAAFSPGSSSSNGTFFAQMGVRAQQAAFFTLHSVFALVILAVSLFFGKTLRTIACVWIIEVASVVLSVYTARVYTADAFQMGLLV